MDLKNEDLKQSEEQTNMQLSDGETERILQSTLKKINQKESRPMLYIKKNCHHMCSGSCFVWHSGGSRFHISY